MADVQQVMEVLKNSVCFLALKLRTDQDEQFARSVHRLVCDERFLRKFTSLRALWENCMFRSGAGKFSAKCSPHTCIAVKKLQQMLHTTDV